jgi:hypothetical protein
MSAFGGKADILDGKADIELAPITVFIGAKVHRSAAERRRCVGVNQPPKHPNFIS